MVETQLHDTTPINDRDYTAPNDWMAVNSELEITRNIQSEEPRRHYGPAEVSYEHGDENLWFHER
jgi:hypothetical protein